jgi:hypothetical protein
MVKTHQAKHLFHVGFCVIKHIIEKSSMSFANSLVDVIARKIITHHIVHTNDDSDHGVSIVRDGGGQLSS